MTNPYGLVALDQLINTLQTDDIIQSYLAMGEKVHENEALVSLYEQYITKQKEIIKWQQYDKTNASKIAEEELSDIENQLFSIPLFNNYMTVQVELNELFQDMTFLIEEKVNQHLSEN